MPTITFWNTDGNATAGQISALAHDWNTDILILAENQVATATLLLALNRGQKRLFYADGGESDRLTILTRFRPGRSWLTRDSSGVAIRHIDFPIGMSMLVVAVHLSSKLWKKTEDQILASTRLARYIRQAEQSVGHTRTIVMGDLNMNPFEVGVVGSEGLHGVMDKEIAAEEARVVQGERCSFFYNPMWTVLGEGGARPLGTYYYRSSSEVNYYWNVFDQVLVRPSLIKLLSDDAIHVVTEIEGVPILTPHGIPDRANASDHLPLVCQLKEYPEQAYDIQ